MEPNPVRAAVNDRQRESLFWWAGMANAAASANHAPVPTASRDDRQKEAKPAETEPKSASTASRKSSGGVLYRMFVWFLAIVLARTAWNVKYGGVDAWDAAPTIVGIGIVFLVVRWIIRSAPK